MGCKELQLHDYFQLVENNCIKYRRSRFTTDANSITRTFTYDNSGSISAVPDLTNSTLISFTLTEYDRAGRTVKSTATNGAITRNEYDATGRTLAVIDTLGNRTSYTYNNAGQQIMVTDALGRETKYEYDALGRQNKITKTVAGIVKRETTYSYNSLNNLFHLWLNSYNVNLHLNLHQ